MIFSYIFLQGNIFKVLSSKSIYNFEVTVGSRKNLTQTIFIIDRQYFFHCALLVNYNGNNYT